MANNVPAPAASKQLTLRDHIDNIKGTLSKMNLLDLLPDTLKTPGLLAKFIEGVGFSIFKNPDLALCDRSSLIAAVRYCVKMGLEPGGEDGCHLVPFRQGGKRMVTPIPSYKGLIKRATETECVTDVNTWIVYENDTIKDVRGTHEDFKYERTRMGKPKGAEVGVVAQFILTNGTKKHFPMDREDIERIRNMSAAWKNAPNTGPWEDNFWAMGMKTAIRAGFKTIPVNKELRRLLETDARIEGGEGVTAIVKELYMEDSGAIPDEVMPEAPATQAQKLTAAIGGEPAPSATEIVKDMAATVGAPEVMNEVEQTIKEVEKGPLFDEDGFKARVNQVVDQITAKTVAWSDIAKWVGPSGPEEITAANIANLEAYVSAYDPARAKKANKGR